MNKQTAEKTVTEYIKPIFGFALKRCKSIEDAEDLSQEIVLRAYRALISKDDINDVSKFIWTVAHNSLSNYYRDSSRSLIGVSIDDLAEVIPDPESEIVIDGEGDTVKRLQSEIAYLSKLQRKIVISYYFENRKQADIARALGIPVGTVKWHLFEAKKELKRGIDTMRKTSELKFNPIKFEQYGINGSIGKKTLDSFLRSSLSQNICYCVRSTAMTVNEIADALGVSPVYVESEVEYLEEYGFLALLKDKYIANFIIFEPTGELLTLKDKMYKRAAELYANELYDELISSGILDDPDIVCNQTDGQITFTDEAKTDKNFLLWSLIPYIAACSGEGNLNRHIKFEDVATVRPDGGVNIASAYVVPRELKLPEDYVQMKSWCGPMWNQIDGGYTHWQIDSQWSGRNDEPLVSQAYQENVRRVLALYREDDKGEGLLSSIDYAFLAERGYVKTCGEYDGYFKSSWQIVCLTSKKIKDRLLEIGEGIKKKHKSELDEIKTPYVKAMLDSVPHHLRKVLEYEMQFVFHSDGWFLLHCIVNLLNNGKLKEPTEGQKKALTTLIISE